SWTSALPFPGNGQTLLKDRHVGSVTFPESASQVISSCYRAAQPSRTKGQDGSRQAVPGEALVKHRQIRKVAGSPAHIGLQLSAGFIEGNGIARVEEIRADVSKLL